MSKIDQYNYDKALLLQHRANHIEEYYVATPNGKVLHLSPVKMNEFKRGLYKLQHHHGIKDVLQNKPERIRRSRVIYSKKFMIDKASYDCHPDDWVAKIKVADLADRADRGVGPTKIDIDQEVKDLSALGLDDDSIKNEIYNKIIEETIQMAIQLDNPEAVVMVKPGDDDSDDIDYSDEYIEPFAKSDMDIVDEYIERHRRPVEADGRFITVLKVIGRTIALPVTVPYALIKELVRRNKDE